MIDKEKVIIMSRLAIYDKKNKEKDKPFRENFQSDYTYKQNIATRFFALIGAFIILIFYYTNRILIDKIDIFELNFKQELINIGTFLVAVLVIYTVIGTLISSVRYNSAQKRMKKYFVLIDRLSNLKTNVDVEETEEDNLSEHGTDIIYKRKHD